jgi:hypothetical protein
VDGGWRILDCGVGGLEGVCMRPWMPSSLTVRVEGWECTAQLFRPLLLPRPHLHCGSAERQLRHSTLPISFPSLVAAGEGLVYRSTEKDLVPFYARVATTTNLRVLVYNGDADPSINSFQARPQPATFSPHPLGP